MRNSLRWLVLSGLACCALSVTLPATASPSIQTVFSPERGALELVLNTIGSARESIRMMGYFFTSPEVVRAQAYRFARIIMIIKPSCTTK